jgi:hypothetical protein
MDLKKKRLGDSLRGVSLLRGLIGGYWRERNGRASMSDRQKRPGSLPGASPFRFATAAYRSSSTTPAGTSCGCAGSSTRGGGAS